MGLWYVRPLTINAESRNKRAKPIGENSSKKGFIFSYTIINMPRHSIRVREKVRKGPIVFHETVPTKPGQAFELLQNINSGHTVKRLLDKYKTVEELAKTFGFTPGQFKKWKKSDPPLLELYSSVGQKNIVYYDEEFISSVASIIKSFSISK